MRSQRRSRQCSLPPQKHPRQYNMPPSVFCDDFILQILSWLPVKSLVRFKCACRSWESLITNPYFVELHLQRSDANPNFTHHRLMSLAYYHRSKGQLRAISSSVRSFLENPSSIIAEDLSSPLNCDYRVIGSCNGLLLCLAESVYVVDWFCLWNPATRLISERLPCPCKERQWRMSDFCPHKFGLGYDHLSDTYKVVAVLFNGRAEEDSKKVRVKVFRTGDNGWRKIQSFPAVPTLRHNDGVYVRGTLNWVAVRNFRTPFKWNSNTIDQLVILSLDLGKETSRTLSWPHGLEEVPYVEPNLAVLSDCLCVCHDYERTHFVVWQMREFEVGNSWTQLLKLSYGFLQIGNQYGCQLPLCLSESGDVLMVSSSVSEAILYKRKDNRVRRSKLPEKIRWVHPNLYVESLVPPP